MVTSEPNAASNRVDAVKELFTDARVESLNAVLLVRGIGADKIIAILHVPGQTMAMPTPPQFRVLYRAG